jgi:hypothetical protein
MTTNKVSTEVLAEALNKAIKHIKRVAYLYNHTDAEVALIVKPYEKALAEYASIRSSQEYTPQVKYGDTITTANTPSHPVERLSVEDIFNNHFFEEDTPDNGYELHPINDVFLRDGIKAAISEALTQPHDSNVVKSGEGDNPYNQNTFFKPPYKWKII